MFHTPSTLNFVQPRRRNIATIEIINYSFGDLFFPVVRPDTQRRSAAIGGSRGVTGRGGPRGKRADELVAPDAGARRRDAVCAALSLACRKLLYFKYAERRRLGGDCVFSRQISMLNTEREGEGEGEAKRGLLFSACAPFLHPAASATVRAAERVKNERHRRDMWTTSNGGMGVGRGGRERDDGRRGWSEWTVGRTARYYCFCEDW
jgi:hypothetical protein